MKFKNPLAKSIFRLIATGTLLCLTIPISATQPVLAAAGDITTISNFETGAEWTYTSGTGGRITSPKMQGDYALYAIASVAGGTITLEKTVALDLSNHYVEFWLRYGSWNYFNTTASLLIDFQVGGTWVKYFRSDYTAKVSQYSTWWDNNWLHISIPRSTTTAVGGAVIGDWASITAIRFNFVSKAAQTQWIYLDELQRVESPATGQVTFTFDDGVATQYTVAKAYMDTYDYDGVAFVLTDEIDGVGYLTLAQLQEMYSIGWDISVHGTDYTDSASMQSKSEAEARAIYESAQNYLIANGFDRSYRYAALHASTETPLLLTIIDDYFDMQRFVSYDLETTIPSNRYYIGNYQVADTDSLAELEVLVDRANTYHEWVIFGMHEITNVGARPTPADFQALVDYIDSVGIPVVTFSDVEDDIVPDPPSQYTTHWWNTDWDCRNTLSFNSYALSEYLGDSLTNFVVPVFLDDTKVDFDQIKADGADIRFVDKDDTTELDYEIEEWDDTGKTAIVWVKIPEIDANSLYTDWFYIYYGNSAAVDAQDPETVWADYYLVQHLEEASGTLIDSSPDNNDMTNSGATYGIAGKIGNALSFGGDGDYTYTGATVSVGAFYATAWFKRLGDSGGSGDSSNHSIIQQINGYATNRLFLNKAGITVAASVSIGTSQKSASATGVDPAVINKIGILWDGSRVYAFLNGVAGTITAAAYGALDSGASVLTLGRQSGSYFWANGIIDEVRITTAKDNNWIKAEYLAETDNLLYYGAEDPSPSVTTLSATNVYMSGGTYATLRGSLDNLGGDPNGADIWFEWGYNTSYGNTVGLQEGATDLTTYTYALSGYDPARTVHYRFVGENIDGITYGSDQTFLVSDGATIAYRIMTNILTLAIAAALLLAGFRMGAYKNLVTGLIWITAGTLAIAIVLAVLNSMW